MKKLVMLLFALGAVLNLFAQSASDDFSGKWKTDQGNIIIIEKIGNDFVGKDATKDVAILKKLSFTGDAWKGQVFNPKKDVTADVTATLEGNTLKLLAKKGFMTKEINWKKVK